MDAFNIPRIYLIFPGFKVKKFLNTTLWIIRILYLSDDWVVSSGDLVEHSVYPLHSFLILGCHSIILLIVVLHAATF